MPTATCGPSSSPAPAPRFPPVTTSRRRRRPACGRSIRQGKSHAEYIEFWQRLDGSRVNHWEHMWNLGKPIIAAVNGWAMGGGFWYQLAADITIASDKATFAQPEVRQVSNTSYLLTALCGWKAANRWALTGDHFDAQEALRIGMVNEVVPHDELMPRAPARSPTASRWCRSRRSGSTRPSPCRAASLRRACGAAARRH